MQVVRGLGLLCVLALLSVLPVCGQEVRLFDERMGLLADTLDAAQPQPFVLQPFVVPGSEQVWIEAAQLDTSRYRIDYRRGRLWVEQPVGAQIIVHYRTLPFRFKDVYRRRRTAGGALPDSTGAAVEPASGTEVKGGPLQESRLQHSGSITRGILAGNHRDVTVESGLRMQLSGEVAEGVNVRAVLTDRNTPILPEGTTQRIEEFDRVFIEVGAPVGTAQLGDVDLTFDGTEFARFSRKVQGVSMKSDLSGVNVVVAGAATRGTFRTQSIEPVDGVQGPYRLEGDQGERFILVIPGTEVVYMDGVRLTRGETNDYVIDYATAEITFTLNRIVTSDRRIRVEYQYTTNQYTRTLAGMQAEARLGQRGAEGRPRARIGAAYVREADSHLFSGAMGLSPVDSMALVQAGDRQAMIRGAEVVPFDPEAPYTQYLRQPLAGTSDSVFVAVRTAPPEGAPVHRVHFSHVGEGQGHYARVGRSVNGVVYEYRGAGRGAYEPVRILAKPKQQHLLDLHGSFALLPALEVFGEWAHSVHDENRLSTLDGTDDPGDAYLAGVRLQPQRLAIGGAALGHFSGSVQRRFTGQTFTPFGRIRPVEFDRRWNLLGYRPGDVQASTPGGDEVVDEAQIQWDVTPQSRVRAELGRIALGGLFYGQRRSLSAEAAEKGWPHVEYHVEDIYSQDRLVREKGRWLRQSGALRYPLLGGRLVPHVEVEQEDRRQRAFGTDSLARHSFSFIEVRPGLDWASGPLETGGGIELRTERGWAEGDLRDRAKAWTVQAHTRYRPDATLETDAALGYRVKRYTPYFRIEQQQENSGAVLLRWNSRYRPLKRAVQLHGRYEALTERTPVMQEIYVRAGPEIGQYVWEDGNGDGVIQVDEFLPERIPNEGAYVKTFIPSDTLMSVVDVRARLRLDLEPARIWREAGAGWKRWLARLTARTTVEVQEKSRDPEVARIYLLDLQHFRDPVHTMDGRLRLAQDLYLFRGHRDYGVDVHFNQLRTLSRLAAGREMRFVNTWRVEGRFRPAPRWGLKLVSAAEQNRVRSEMFASRRYDIRGLRIEPEISFSPSRAVQLIGKVSFAHKKDAFAGRTARVLRLPLEGRYNVVRRMQLTGRLEVARVGLTGEAAGLALFELTDGRGPGTSMLWNVGGQYRLTHYLRASLSYDGRAPSGAPSVHTLRLQLSAIF